MRLVFGLQVYGCRVSTESCRGGAQAGRQLWRPLLDRGRKRRRKAGFLVCATKQRRPTAVEDAKSWRHGRRSRDWRWNGRRRRLGPRCGRRGDGRRAASRAVRRPRRERRLGPRRGGGNLPARGVLAVSQNQPPTQVSRTLQNRGPDLHPHGGIAEKTSTRRKNIGRRMSPCIFFWFCPYGLSSV